jgi:hypothetical protein
MVNPAAAAVADKNFLLFMMVLDIIVCFMVFWSDRSSGLLVCWSFGPMVL